ncbi:MAG: zinc-binding alcohol dehydrogenase [Chloroflexota bacterium]|nr:zinc-binding alcohol dehydrogenase [Chloroflexota bacterium]MDE2908737.1 zinc-binding alcohol dehydrogenase [Chloroflexota bacterium]
MENLSVLFTAPDQVETQRIDDDIGQLRARDVLVKTRYSVISAATELACLSGSQRWFPFPGTPGYAAVGEVVDVGGEIADVAPGDMVHFWGGHKQYSLVDTARPTAICLKAPAGLPLELAPFTRMAIIAMTSLRISNIELGDYVGVVGLGTVGNFAAQLAGLQGGTVIGLDLSEGRAERARACGIAQALVGDGASVADRVREITDGEGVSTLIEATGIPAALPPALPLVGRYGEAILLGTPRGVHETDLTSSVLDYIHLHGHGSITFKGAHEWRYPVARDAYVKHSMERNSVIAMDLIASGALKAAPLHTHTLSPAEAESAYEGLKSAKDEYVGVVFDWTLV